MKCSSRLCSSLTGNGTRRMTRIVIPNLKSDRQAPAGDAFASNGAMGTSRFVTGGSGSSNNVKRLYVDTPYVSSSDSDRWTGQGPTNLKSGRRGGARPDDVNNHSRKFGKVRGAPTSDETSPGEEEARVLGGAESDFVRRQKDQQRFLNAVDSQHEQVWRDSKSHIRRQERAMASHGGIEGAISERLMPSGTSETSELKRRPLDRRILEEIYKDLHGHRSEQALKRNVYWERWSAKSDTNAPVMSASRKAQETFGFGGEAKLVRSATTREQFPVTPLPEVAFLGRTNSGRSSLINAILNRYVCRYGHLKGTTKSADFVNVADKLMLVDLPGYGYFHPFSADPLRVKQGQNINESYINACAIHTANTKSSSETSQNQQVPQNIQTGRQRNLKRVFGCVPCVTGLQDGDLSLCDLLQDRGIPFSILLTKTDLMPIRTLARMADLTRSKLVKYTHCEELLLVNALRLAGITRIQNILGNVARKQQLAADPLEMSFDTIV